MVQHRAALETSGAVPSQNTPTPSVLEGCAQRYAPQADYRVDPFGILGLVDLWPANSTARVRPRPFPVGPAYNSSEFDLFTNVSIVSLVRLPSPALRAACAVWSVDNVFALLAGHANAHFRNLPTGARQCHCVCPHHITGAPI